MKLKYQLSKLAITDLDSIWLYTANEHSIKQANAYYNEIFDVIDLICGNPYIGRSIQEIQKNHRSKLAMSHMIIYKIENNKIFIDRILHQKMDIEYKLNE